MHQGHRRRDWFCLSMTLLAVTGCAGLKEPKYPEAKARSASYPKLQATPDRPAPLARKVTTLAADSPSTGTAATAAATPVEMPIDLPTVLRLAGTDALEVKLASQQLAEAEARRLAADFQFLPVIQPGIAARWHNGIAQAVTGEFLDVDKRSAQTGVGISAEWRLGESIFQSLAARRRVAAGQAGVQASRDEARLQAVSAFFNLVQARADQAIIEERIKQADETVRITQALAEVGAGLRSEVKRAEAARAEVRQRLATARERVRLASLELTTALNIDPLVSLTPRQEPQDLITLVPAEKELADLVSQAMSNRPELEESRARWAALNDERKAALIGPLIPTLRADAFSGSLGRNPGDADSTHDYGLGLQWNIGRGGLGDISRTRLARAQQEQESLRFEQILDQVARDVITQQVRVETAREQIKLSQEEIKAAEETLRLSRERMQSGAALTIEVLNAEDLVASAKLRAAQQVSEFNKAQYGLLRSIGGFRSLNPSAGKPSPRVNP